MTNIKDKSEEDSSLTMQMRGHFERYPDSKQLYVRLDTSDGSIQMYDGYHTKKGLGVLAASCTNTDRTKNIHYRKTHMIACVRRMLKEEWKVIPMIDDKEFSLKEQDSYKGSSIPLKCLKQMILTK